MVSDGIAFDQYFEENFFWIPQQLWDFKFQKKGLWTICMHPNGMNDESLELFKENLILYKNNIISLDEVKLNKKRKSFRSQVYSSYFWNKYRVFKTINELRK
jgi:hypothetical protein